MDCDVSAHVSHIQAYKTHTHTRTRSTSVFASERKNTHAAHSLARSCAGRPKHAYLSLIERAVCRARRRWLGGHAHNYNGRARLLDTHLCCTRYGTNAAAAAVARDNHAHNDRKLTGFVKRCVCVGHTHAHAHTRVMAICAHNTHTQ